MFSVPGGNPQDGEFKSSSGVPLKAIKWKFLLTPAFAKLQMNSTG